MTGEDGLTPEAIEQEFAGWEVFQGVDRRWHARIRGATPPVMVHDDHLTGLREEILRKVSQIEEASYRRQMVSRGTCLR
jgi:hypothetical protein